MKKWDFRNISVYLNDVLKLLPGSIYLKDVNGVYLGCNEFQAKMSGYDSPDDVIGKTDYDMPWKDGADVITATDRRIMKSCIPEEVVEKAVGPDSREIIMLSLKAPLYNDDGEVIGIVGTSLDITDRKKAEEREKIALIAVAEAEARRKKAEEELRRAVTVLAGSIAHDLRTPLFILRNLNHGLKDFLGGKAIPDGESMEELRQIPERIDRVISDMNTFIDHNLKALKQSITGLAAGEEDLIECKSYKGINNAIDSWPFRPGERDLVEVDNKFHFNFRGNPVLFTRIIFNLLANSLYQIECNGKGHIYISAEEGSGYNLIRFRDTAGGAPAEVIEHIFDGYRTTREDGTGIGLAFCRLTMKSFGGDIICHGVEGDFIEFILKFPKI